jgi:hypothetical protein
VIRCILSSASAIGARQCATLHKQYAMLNQFPPTSPVVWAQVAEKCFLRNPGCCPFKIKEKYPAPQH